MRVLVVGAGFSGMTAAVLLCDAGHEVKVLEQRGHLGGNCYDTYDHGIFVHQYGPHIFHTNNEAVWSFVNRFANFVPYEHKVVARTHRHPCLLPIPYNQHTEKLIGRRLEDEEIIEYFFKEYSQKMWGMPWEELPECVAGRVPKRRENSDCRYFTDKFQGMPEEGFTEMFYAMAQLIGDNNIEYNVSPYAWVNKDVDVIIFTGSIDEYHNFKYGELPYRTLDIEHITDFPTQQGAVINECNHYPFTRTTDYSWFYKEKHHKTVVTREYPRDYSRRNSGDIRYYPMPWGQSTEIYTAYSSAPTERPTVFCGRLGTYQYMNIDVAIADTITKIDKLLGGE